MNKKKFILVGIVAIIIIFSLVVYKHIENSFQLKNQLYAEIKNLTNEARNKYMYVSEGGNNPIIKQEDLSKMLIVDPNINSREKILKFLQKTYTNNASKNIYDNLGYKEINGELYKEINDSVFLYDWNEASVENIKINPLNKNATVIFSLTNPMLNDRDIVKFKLIMSNDNIYKIDNIIGGW